MMRNLTIALLILAITSPSYAQVRKHVADPDEAASAKCLIPWDPLKLCGQLTGQPAEDFQRVVKRIQALQKPDIDYAILKAEAANTAASAVRLQCLRAISDANDQFNGAGLKDANGNVIPRPDPAYVTAIEDTAELVDNLSPQGKLFTACAGAAQMSKSSTLAFVNAIVTGAANIVAAPAGL
jgi:hypothetical protein